MNLVEQIQSLTLPEAEHEAFLRRVQDALAVEDYQRVKAMAGLLLAARELLLNTELSNTKLRRLVFGPKSEKTVPPSSPDSPATPVVPKCQRRGHGRRGAERCPGARRVVVCHPALRAEQACEQCGQGKLRAMKRRGVAMRYEGAPSVTGTVYEQENLRCDACGIVFTAPLPPEAGTGKYADTVGPMVALFRYGAGMPHHRLAQLQESLGVPLPESTQWDVMAPVVEIAGAVFPELIRQAAQAPLLHVDDTGMRVGDLRGKQSTETIDPKRKGTFTTTVVGESNERSVLFFTGWRHAGENLATVLGFRGPELDPPIQMCDALSRNVPKGVSTQLSNCLSHARREFVDLATKFQAESRLVLGLFQEVYRVDGEARKLGMDPNARLVHHQKHSGPVMRHLQEWMAEVLAKKQVEPNSGLGSAIEYMQNHWEALTLFLRVPNVPLDNNLAERTLKMAILHRKNSMGYKTVGGAKAGDHLMSLIQTCRANSINPFEYLLALVRNPAAVIAKPSAWLPWNYPRPPAK